VIATWVIPADIVTPEDENVGFLLSCLRKRRYEYRGREYGAKDSGWHSFHDYLGDWLDLSWPDLVAVEKRAFSEKAGGSGKPPA
jgi:hypothetical protein